MAVVKKVTKKLGVTKSLKVSTDSKETFKVTTELSEPCESLSDYSVLIYGEKKIGKTSTISKFEGAYFCMFEPGGKALRIMQDIYEDWGKFRKAVPQIVRSSKIKNVVIDTADFAYKACLHWVCEKLCIDHPQDEGYGKGWEAVRDEMDEQFRKLFNSGKGVWFTSHYTDREIKKANGEEYLKTSPTMAKQVREYLEGIVDIWVFYTYEKGRRVMYLQGDDYVSAGHRVEGRFLYTDGSPIVRLDMGNSPQEAHDIFVKAFENKVGKTNVVDVKKVKPKRIIRR